MAFDSEGMAKAILGGSSTSEDPTLSLGEEDIDSEQAAIEAATGDFIDASQSGDITAASKALKAAILAIYPRSALDEETD